MAAGFDAERFWRITLREVEREFRGVAKRGEREADERTWLAWHTVALDRTERLPKLQDLLTKPEPEKRKKSGEEMLLAMKGIFLAHGGNPDDLKVSNDQ